MLSMSLVSACEYVSMPINSDDFYLQLDVQAPAVAIPTDDMFYSKEFPDRPDIAFLKNHFYREGRISEEQAIFILQKGTELLKKEPNLLEVDAPITGTSE